MVIAILDCIQFGVGIAAFLDELPCLLGGVRVWFPVSRAVDVPADAHLLSFLGREYLLVGTRPALISFGSFLRGIIRNGYDNECDDTDADDNPGSNVLVCVPGL